MEEEELQEKEKAVAAASISQGHPVLSLHALHRASKQHTSPANPALSHHSLLGGHADAHSAQSRAPWSCPLPCAAPGYNAGNQSPANAGPTAIATILQLPGYLRTAGTPSASQPASPSPSKPAETLKPVFPNSCSQEAQPSFHFQTSSVPCDMSGEPPEPEFLEVDFDDFLISVFCRSST